MYLLKTKSTYFFMQTDGDHLFRSQRSLLLPVLQQRRNIRHSAQTEAPRSLGLFTRAPTAHFCQSNPRPRYEHFPWLHSHHNRKLTYSLCRRVRISPTKAFHDLPYPPQILLHMLPYRSRRKRVRHHHPISPRLPGRRRATGKLNNIQ